MPAKRIFYNDIVGKVPLSFLLIIQHIIYNGDKVRRTMYKVCESVLVVKSLLSIMIYVVCVCFVVLLQCAIITVQHLLASYTIIKATLYQEDSLKSQLQFCLKKILIYYSVDHQGANTASDVAHRNKHTHTHTGSYQHMMVFLLELQRTSFIC